MSEGVGTDRSDRALLLDLDGTLADSLSALKQVYRTFLAQFGIVGTETEFQSLNGPPLREVCRILGETHGLPGGVDALYANYQQFLAEAHTDIRPALGAETVLEAAKLSGWKVAVVTSTPRIAAQGWIDRHGLGGMIDFIVGGDDVVKGKPDPEPYLLAISRSGCAAERCIAVEDSPKGASAAIAAGIPTWLLGPEVPVGLAQSPQLQGCLSAFGSILDLVDGRRPA